MDCAPPGAAAPGTAADARVEASAKAKRAAVCRLALRVLSIRLNLGRAGRDAGIDSRPTRPSSGALRTRRLAPVKKHPRRARKAGRRHGYALANGLVARPEGTLRVGRNCGLRGGPPPGCFPLAP